MDLDRAEAHLGFRSPKHPSLRTHQRHRHRSDDQCEQYEHHLHRRRQRWRLKTDDDGKTWRALTDTQCSLAMGAIAIDPNNNRVIYAGTGEGPTIGSSYLSGCGLLKSTDGGVTWTQMGASVFDPPNQEGARIWKIAITGNTVMVASTFGVFRSTDGGSTFTP